MVGSWSALLQDVQFTLRLLRRQPGFALVSLVVLGIGTGAMTTVVTGVLLCVGIASALLPAWRASTLSPAEALRHD